MRKLFAITGCAIIGAVGAMATGALAQNSVISAPKTPIPNFDVQSVGPILTELGVTWQAQKSEDGATYIAANVAGQVNFVMAPAACRGAGQTDCVGISMVAIFDGQANPQTVQAFNYRYAFASAGIHPSGSAYLSRYEIADFGVPRGNLATSITVFANQIVTFGRELESAQRTVSLEGYADDLSAGYLNAQGATMMAGDNGHTLSSLEQHQQGFELAAEQVKGLISSKNTPRNKIRNVTK